MKKTFTSTLFLTLSIFLLSCTPQKTETESQYTPIHWWHSMTGTLGEKIQWIAQKYNQSQEKYRVFPQYKGNYTESLNAGIAAFRGGKQPHLLQVFEVGTLGMMNSNAIIPVQKLIEKSSGSFDSSKYINPILSYYQSKEGSLLSLPFNSSTPVLYYNKRNTARARIKAPGTTWKKIFEDLTKIKNSGLECGLSAGWQSWTLLENFSAINDLPFSNLENGFAGNKAKLNIANNKLENFLNKLAHLQKSGAFQYEGRRTDPARKAFLNKKCTYYLGTSASFSTIKKIADFPWGVSYFSHLEYGPKKNSIIGGASLWAFKGHSEEENIATGDFLSFLAQKEIQLWWHKETGYLPLSKEAYQAAKASGYYQKNPGQEIAIKQLLRGKQSIHSKGIRLGNFPLIREIINEELEQLWSGKKDALTALQSATKRGNKVLERYAKSQQEP